ncbi:MAG: NIPSNAP family protein [Herminiimonas sp.]|nr:NIPSNAP family protein [Herminiimonas sp.]
MIYEMRVYHCAPGRLPALNNRFETITLKFWEKYGIEPVGFWTTLVGASNQTLTYMLRWESLAERERKWNAFASDSDWIARRAATEAEAIIVERIENTILNPTSYSALR